eukprot:160519-Karenia_brevis.AAC.1
MENDLDLEKVSDYLKQAQTHEIARERLQAAVGSPLTTSVNANLHDPEHNMNLDDWRSGKRKQTSSFLKIHQRITRR